MMMVAKKDMKYNGAHLRVGDHFDAVSDRAVRLFTLSKRAEVVKGEAAEKVQREIDMPAAPVRRRYNRRDMQAQD